MRHDQHHHYTTLTKLFHWVTAPLILWQFAKFFDRINDGEHWVGEHIASFHITVGTVFVLLVIARILWAFTQLKHRPVNPQSSTVLSRLGHLALYALMLLMPLLGICFMVGNGYGLKVFDWQIVARGDEIPLLISLGSLHSPAAWVLLITILGHVGMAIKHTLSGDKKLIKSML